MARPGYTDWIWVPFLRRCLVGLDKVEITPIVVGQGFVFDGMRRVVTIRRCLLGRMLSEEEIPFSDIGGIHLSESQKARPKDISDYHIELRISTRDRHFLIPVGWWKRRADSVLAAILKVTTPARE